MANPDIIAFATWSAITAIFLTVNPDIIAFATWSAITAIFLTVIGLVYRRFKMKKDAPSSH